MTASLSELQGHARSASAHARTPFSGQPDAVALLLSDGTWVPGVRVESATYSLVIPALLNAYTTAIAVERDDVVAAASSRPFRPEERLYLQQALEREVEHPEASLLVRTGTTSLPPLTHRLIPLLSTPLPKTPNAGIALARDMARRAHVPTSEYPVGAVLVGVEDEQVPGVNVEHPDWSRILCAERNALSTAVSYDITPREMYLTCLLDPKGTPCGACRQVLAELAPGMDLWMDRGEAPPVQTDPESLLPGAFRGEIRSLS